jgi:hypothetical protein
VLGVFPALNRSSRANQDKIIMNHKRTVSIAASAIVSFVRNGGQVYVVLPDLPVVRKALKCTTPDKLYKLASARCERLVGKTLSDISYENFEKECKKPQTTQQEADEKARAVLETFQGICRLAETSKRVLEERIQEVALHHRVFISSPEIYWVGDGLMNWFVTVGDPKFSAVAIPNPKIGVKGEVTDSYALLQKSAEFDPATIRDAMELPELDLDSL